jgi:hypothetical protein
MIMHHIALCTLCIAFALVSHICAFMLDPVEQGPKEPPDPAQLEDTNQEQEQGKP